MSIATSSDILNGKTGYTAPNGTKITGNLTGTKSWQSYQRRYGSDLVINGGVYLTGDLTIYGITCTASTSDYKYGASMTVRGGNSYYMNSTGYFTGDANATSSAILSGYGGFVKGSLVSGSMTSSDLNPYPVSNGYTTYSNGDEVGYRVSASPSSGNGSSASYSVGIHWSGGTLAYTGAASGKTYDTFVLSCSSVDTSAGTITCTFIGSHGWGPTFTVPISNSVTGDPEELEASEPALP